MTATQPRTSSYWLTDAMFEAFRSTPTDDEFYVFRLHSIRRAIANFVRIVTGKDIPVVFSSGEQSYTNLRKVVLAADDRPEMIDKMVGLALHEAVHLILSQPTTYPDSVPWFELAKHMQDAGYKYHTPQMVSDYYRLNRGCDGMKQDIHLILNFLEDRRTDKWMYQQAPGYRGYYDALYQSEWSADQLAERLVSPVTDPTLQSYRFHIINMTHELARPDALPGLQEIWDLIDLDTIERLGRQDTHWESRWPELEHLPEMIQIALKIVAIMYANATPEATREEPNAATLSVSDPNNHDIPDVTHDQEKENEDAEGAGDSSGDSQAQGQNESPDRDDRRSPNAEKQHQAGGNSGDDDARDHRAADKDAEAKLNAQIQQILHGQQKTSPDSKLLSDLEQFEAPGAKLGHTQFKQQRVPVMIYRQLTKSLIAAPWFDLSHVRGGPATSEMIAAIEAGVRRGNLLTHQLQVLAEESPLTYHRVHQGRLDKRALAGLGYGEEAVFEQTHIERQNPILVHLSLDASSSMGGSKWHRTIALAVALAKAAENIRTLDVVISMRWASMRHMASLLIAYDSRTDPFSKIRSLWPQLYAHGGTPEGLTFEAIYENFLKTGKHGQRQFFVNVSDGEPDFASPHVSLAYRGPAAYAHTRQQVEQMRAAGVIIMSYFVSNAAGEMTHGFEQMYGKDARFIDVGSVPRIASTLNQMFLQTGDGT